MKTWSGLPVSHRTWERQKRLPYSFVTFSLCFCHKPSCVSFACKRAPTRTQRARNEDLGTSVGHLSWQVFGILLLYARLACNMTLLGAFWQNVVILPLYARLACIIALLGTSWQNFSYYRSDYLIVLLFLAFAFAASLCADLSRAKRYQQEPKIAQNEDLGTSVGHPSNLGKTKETTL